MCSHFDSPSVFGAILDDNKGGQFQISPIGDQVRYKQSIGHPRTSCHANSCFLTESAELEDFMPVGLPPIRPGINIFIAASAAQGACAFRSLPPGL